MVVELMAGSYVQIDSNGSLWPGNAANADAVVMTCHTPVLYEVMLRRFVVIEGFGYDVGVHLALPAGERDVPAALDRPTVEAWLDA